MSEEFLRNARGLPMCSQVLCHGLYMMSALSVFPHSLLMSSAHKAMGRNFIITSADSVPQNNAQALAKDASNGTVVKVLCSVHAICFFSSPYIRY